MKERGPIGRWFFGELQQEEFSTTPLLDYIEAEQVGTLLLPVVTRDEALSVPGVMRARNMIAAIATLPLKTYSADWRLIDNALFRQIDPTRSNVTVLADTLEDLLFNKFAYWHVIARDAKRYPISAEYVAFSRVQEQVEHGRNTIRIDGDLASWEDVIKFESPNPGFLKHGGRVVKRALDLDVTAAKYARNPMPLSYFRPTGDVDPGDETYIRAFLQKWKNWLRRETTGYVPPGMELVPVSQPTPAEMQLIEAQKQVGLSIANMTGLDPEDLGISTTSRTYFNADDRRQTKINDVLSPYMLAITDRLSMGDVTKRGQVVKFDLTDYMKADDATRVTVQIAYKNAGLATEDEIRAQEHLPPIPKQSQSTNVPETPVEEVAPSGAN